MKFWKIFRFEFASHLRSFSTWLYLAVLLLFTVVMNVLTTPGDGVNANATFYIVGVAVIGGVIWLVMGATIAGEAAARDVQTRMHPLTYSTPVTKLSYLGGRFLAALAVNTLLIISVPLGVLLAFHLPMDQGQLGPFMPWAYLSVLLSILLPNAFIATSLQFTFAALSRHVMTSYFASLVLAIFPQVIAISVANLFGKWELVELLDPIGIAGIIGSELKTWTVADKNTRLIPLEGVFLWNRILWLGIAVCALLLTYFRFSFTHHVTKRWLGLFKRKTKVQTITSEETLVIVGSTAIAVPKVQRSFGFATWFRQTLAIAWASFRKIARNPVGLTLVGAIALTSAMFGSRIITQFSIPMLPTTQKVLAYLTAPVADINTPWVVIPLLIMYFGGALVWNDRDARLSDIADAAPVPEWALFTGKFLGLCFVIFVWMALLMAGGILMQIGLDYDNFQTGLYMQTLFGLQLVNYSLFALLVLVVYVVVNQKYIGSLVVLLVFIFIAFPSTFRVDHNMLIFGADPGWWYTDMRGFGNTIWPWLCFKIYWIAWALLLAVVARLVWPRGREQGLRNRIKAAKRGFTRSTMWVTISASVLIMITGGFIFYNTNVLNEYLTGSEIYERHAEYELRYGKYRNTPQPQLIATKLNVEIYPDQQQVDIRAAYTLVNKDSLAIDSIHLGSVSNIELREVKFSRQAEGVVIDKELCHHIYALQQPLRPGDSIQVNFVVNFKQRGFRQSGTNELVVNNGTYFTNYDLFPAIGYQRYRELNNAVIRKKYKLAARPALPSLDDREARKKSMGTDQNSLEVIVGTVKNEVAVAPGILHRSWTESNRRYFHYKTEAPIGPEFAILSSNYSVHQDFWNDVAIRIYYHPGHAMHLDRMLRSVKESLDYFTRQFGPYPYDHLTIVERAGSGSGASADASMINYGEQYSLLHPDDSPSGFDLPYYILAHEVAHQWWGIARLTPAHVEGGGVLIEGLAVYSGMQVLEKNYGEHHLQQYVSYLHSAYEMPRSLATPPLLRADETFLYYRKGGLAMHALSKYIGNESVNDALRSLLQKRTSGDITMPTTLDLYHEIQKVTPDSLDYMLKDFFETNTYWRLKTKQFAAVQTQAGSWEVTLKIMADKVVVDSTGSESPVSMNDWLEVGIFEKGKSLDQPLYLQRHRIRSGEQTIKVIVPRKPERGGIDPNNLTIDLRRDDNILYLKEE